MKFPEFAGICCNLPAIMSGVSFRYGKLQKNAEWKQCYLDFEQLLIRKELWCIIRICYICD